MHNVLCITKRISKVPHTTRERRTSHNLVQNRDLAKYTCPGERRTLHNLVENPEALGFHQEIMKDPIEQMETMEIQQTSQDWFCIKLYFYLLEKITTSFSYNTEIQNPICYFNVSGNIIK